jgi:hypothetical protein
MASFKLVAGTNTLAHFKGRYSQKNFCYYTSLDAPISLTNIRQGCKILPDTNTVAYLSGAAVTKEIKF